MLRRILDQATETGAAPGGILLVGDQGQIRERIAFGITQIEPPGRGVPVTPDTKFDAASLTKPTATVSVLMKLVGRGALGLDDKVRTWIPELNTAGSENTRIRDLLSHSSGLPAHLEFYERILAGERGGAPSAREAMLRFAATTPFVYEPGTQTVYSDLGFILLGFVIERATGQRLDRCARELVFGPIGMKQTAFVDLDSTERPYPVAATERCPYRGLVVGEVHDQNTHAARGILGQAGMFTTADDLGLFACAIINAGAGFDRDVLEQFFVNSGVPGATRCYGWDSPSPVPGESHAGDLWPRTSLGHLGFTGCSMWIDRARGRFAVLLTNSIHPKVQKAVTKALRRRVMDEAWRTLSAS